MHNFVKHFVPKKIKELLLPYRKQYYNFKTLAYKYNQLQSIKECKCVDKDGLSIPWYTYPAIEYLRGLNFSTKSILEWGGGPHHFFGQRKQKN